MNYVAKKACFNYRLKRPRLKKETTQLSREEHAEISQQEVTRKRYLELLHKIDMQPKIGS